MKKFFKFFCFFSITLVSACSVVETQPKKVSLESYVKEFVFMKELPTGDPLTDDMIREELKSEIQESSKIKGMSRYYTGVSGLYDLKGLEVKSNDSELFVSYVNGEYFSDTDSSNTTSILASYELKIEEQGDLKTVSVVTPNFIEVKPGNSAILLPISPLVTTQEAKDDIERINSRIHPEFDGFKEFSGDFNVKYNDESVYANFTRILGEYQYNDEKVKKYDIQKGKLFELGDNEDSFPVKITVFPYRNGSKVVYKFRAPFVLKNDGTTTFDEGKIEKYIDRIKEVAKD